MSPHPIEVQPGIQRPGVFKALFRGLQGALLLSLIVTSGVAQNTSLSRGPHRLEIAVEKRVGSRWQRVDPRLVFEQNDRVRFRVKPNFGGYLYVMNSSTSGDYALLFPREETGQENQIEAGREYLVPATKGAFRLTGPAGHEVVYWVVSPVEFGQEDGGHEYKPLPPPPDRRTARPNLIPRCDDTILRARGDCVDTSAGAKAVEDSRELPENMAGLPNANSRQLLFVQKKRSSVVSSPPTLKGPVIFEFRIAHR